MKLSEAIRLGSMLGPQARGDLFKSRRKYCFGLIGPVVVNETCAMGAAITATGGPQFGITDHEYDSKGFRGEKAHLVRVGTKHLKTPDEWQSTLWRWQLCPMCDRQDWGIRVIPHLNDDHRWTREAIADWIEMLESGHAERATQESAGAAT